MIELFAVLVFLHFLFDYPLQGDFLSKAKNRFNPIPHVPWYQAMFAHTFIHGFVVYWVTGYWVLGVFEMITHWRIDILKCKGELTFNQDQAYHIAFKFLWVLFAVFFDMLTGVVI